jgi:cell division transport system permease protein
MIRHLRRALADIRANRLVNAVTVVTVCLAVVIVCAALLLDLNTRSILEGWQKDTRLMVYLKPGAGASAARLQQTIEAMEGVRACRFVPKDEALQDLQRQLSAPPSLFENLEENPLPDAFEIGLGASSEGWLRANAIAARIGALPEVDAVEYGRKWADLLRTVLKVVQTAGAAVIGLLAVSAVAIVGAMTRLVVYSRREEMEILRLIGAAEGFIRTPFYIGGALQGLIGGGIGLAVLALVFNAVMDRIGEGALPMLPIRFFEWDEMAAVVAGSVLVGWLGAWASLQRSLRSTGA